MLIKAVIASRLVSKSQHHDKQVTDQAARLQDLTSEMAGSSYFIINPFLFSKLQTVHRGLVGRSTELGSSRGAAVL